jgi:hypothetical protein
MFKNRTQVVKYNNVLSDSYDVTSGVLQGGVISPILFNLYIADIVFCIESEIFKFADDMVVLKPIYSLNDCINLQNDLKNIEKFCKDNNLVINPSKCETMRFSLKKLPIQEYMLNDILIKSVDFHKQVGVIYDSKLNFNKHIEMLTKKAIKKFYIIKNICKRVNGSVFLNLYKTYILPILEYSNLCLTLNKTQTKQLEKIQRTITKFICWKNGENDINYVQRLKSLKIDSLEKRRIIQILKLIFKIKHKKLGIDKKWFNDFNFYTHQRLGDFCKISMNRLTKSDKHIFNYSVKLFNKLPKNVRIETKLSEFVIKLNECIECTL